MCERESESTHLPACRNQFTATAAAAQFTFTPGLVACGRTTGHRLRGAGGTDTGGGLSSSIAT